MPGLGLILPNSLPSAAGGSYPLRWQGYRAGHDICTIHNESYHDQTRILPKDTKNLAP